MRLIYSVVLGSSVQQVNQLYKCTYPFFLKLFSQITELTFNIHVFVFYPNSVLYLLFIKLIFLFLLLMRWKAVQNICAKIWYLRRTILDIKVLIFFSCSYYCKQSKASVFRKSLQKQATFIKYRLFSEFSKNTSLL